MWLSRQDRISITNALLLCVILTLCVVCAEQCSVVIIGAGPAGLAAATRLLAHNLTDVNVLEAENRVGGRVNSIYFGDAVVELGAEWCHGQRENVVYEMVKDLDLLEEYEPALDILFFNGKSLSRNHSEELLEIFMEVSQTIDESVDKNISTRDAFVPAFKEAVKNMYSDNPEILDLALQSLPLMEKYVLALDSSFSWHESSAAKTYQQCPGNQGLTWKGQGYNQIFDVMSKQISESSGIDLLVGKFIHLNKVVSKIDYSGVKSVVNCKDGSQYKADFVLFTPSLGVLRHDYKDLFYPELPEKKVKAIEDLGIDAVIKIVLHYNDIWWPSDLGDLGYNFVFTKEDENEIANFLSDVPVKVTLSNSKTILYGPLEKNVYDGISWPTSILGMLPAENNPNVLSFWLVGPFVPIIEDMSDDKIKTGLNYVLTKCLSERHINITKPDKMIRSSWCTNPHFRGSYSYETIRPQREDVDKSVHLILAETVKNLEGKEVLFFAGEATHLTHYSTVHGAVESGYREADKILAKVADH